MLSDSVLLLILAELLSNWGEPHIDDMNMYVKICQNNGFRTGRVQNASGAFNYLCCAQVS